MNTEIVYFQNDKVLVSGTRYVVSGTTYAIRNISSVGVHKIEKNKSIPRLLLLVGGIAFFATVTVGDRGTEMWIPIGLVLAAIGGVILLVQKDEYTVRITTNAGQRDSYTSSNKALIQEIAEGINQAIMKE